eukprot:scaffold2671_cov252-Pinguiococcus_pyrenoidosus.AAC.8
MDVSKIWARICLLLHLVFTPQRFWAACAPRFAQLCASPGCRLRYATLAVIAPSIAWSAAKASQITVSVLTELRIGGWVGRSAPVWHRGCGR